MKTIMVKDTLYRIVSFLDSDSEETENEEEACFLLLQRPEDKRPSGIQQAYKMVRIKPGSLIKEFHQ